MPEPIAPAAPPTGEPKEPPAPTAGPVAPPAPGGQAPAEPKDTLPEKFKGKSAEDIAKAYLELEKKHGEIAAKVGSSEKQLEDWNALGKVIAGNPELRKSVEDEIAKISGKKEDPKDPKAPAGDSETRKATEDLIINNFETAHGLASLTEEKKVEINGKIAKELRDMLDPTGTKSNAEVFNSIPPSRLNVYLEKAYKLAIIGDDVESARNQAYIDARQNALATMGSMPSSGANRSSVELTPGQREAARRMNISEEDYKKQLVEIEKENK